jgi:hypothetical protein
MRKTFTIIGVLLLLGASWFYLFTGTPPWGPAFTPANTNIVAIDLLWGGTTRTCRNSNQCATVIQTMSTARRYPIAATPAFGSITFYFEDGTTTQFFLEPAGRFNALEIANKSGGYAISMGEMLNTFENSGLLTKEGN